MRSCFVNKRPFVLSINFSISSISLRDGLVVDVSLNCVFKRSSHAPGRWNNGERHTHDVLQVRANVKNNRKLGGDRKA